MWCVVQNVIMTAPMIVSLSYFLSLSLFLRFNLNAARKSVMDIMERFDSHRLGKKKKRFLEQKRKKLFVRALLFFVKKRHVWVSLQLKTRMSLSLSLFLSLFFSLSLSRAFNSLSLSRLFYSSHPRARCGVEADTINSRLLHNALLSSSSSPSSTK